MSSLLEAYLDQVAAHLSALPPKRRNEELREMRQHLLNAVTVNRERGQSEEDAAENAVIQFGTPKDLGGNLVWAWRRGKRQEWKSFIGAVLITFLLLCTVPSLMESLMSYYLPSWSTHHHLAWWLTRNFTAWAVIGVGTGLLFPKRAVAGAALVLGCFTLLNIADFISDNYQNTGFPVGSYLSVKYLLENLFYCQLFATIPMLLVGIFAAWSVSRWRTTVARKSRLARG